MTRKSTTQTGVTSRRRTRQTTYQRAVLRYYEAKCIGSLLFDGKLRRKADVDWWPALAERMWRERIMPRAEA